MGQKSPPGIRIGYDPYIRPRRVFRHAAVVIYGDSAILRPVFIGMRMGRLRSIEIRARVWYNDRQQAEMSCPGDGPGRKRSGGFRRILSQNRLVHTGKGDVSTIGSGQFIPDTGPWNRGEQRADTHHERSRRIHPREAANSRGRCHESKRRYPERRRAPFPVSGQLRRIAGKSGSDPCGGQS